jgi:PAS domain S-box-containing protein
MKTTDPNRNSTPNKDGYPGMVANLDQTAQARKTRAALASSEERFRLLVDAVQDYAIFMLDVQGYITTWNAGARRIKGYEAQEIIGKHFSCFYSPEDVHDGKPDRELRIATAEGRFEEEGWRIRKDGSKFWANVILTALRDAHGKLIGFAKVTRDITERMLGQEKLRAAQASVAESESSLRRLSVHLLRTQDEERRRIGRDLHDSLGQYLSVLMMKLDSMRSSWKRSSESCIDAELAECANLVEESIKEVRTISYLLYPPMLEEVGLSSAVPWYVDGFTKRSGIITSFQISPDFPRLSRESELALFRVLQEALANVHRHSGSTTAHVQLLIKNDSVILIVSDTGKGITSETRGQVDQSWVSAMGVGLRGMNERMKELGGNLELRSSNQGTTVTVTIPVQRCRAEGLPAQLGESAP